MKVEQNKVEQTNGYIVVLFKITAINGTGDLEYYKQDVIGNQWLKESGATSTKMTINLPNTAIGTGKTVEIETKEGYYPVAIYTLNKLPYDTAGSH